MQTQIFASVGVMVTLAAISPAIATEVRNAGWQPGPCGDQYQRSGSADVSKHYTANSDATYRNCERKDDFNQYADDSRPCPTVANKVVSKTAGLGVFTHQSSGTAARNLIKTVEDSGGWRQPESRLRDREKFDSPFCNIERISVLDLTPERFEREYRFKKPVLLTFPRGAVDWTVPDKWKRAELKRTFGEWEVTLYDSVGFYGKLARRKAHLADFIDSMRQYNGPKNAE
ncbi:hypothetical protein BaRGS_00009282 [Batillaria attramentaria]|uniref:Uncharacterized protein n=1 Tax=Batillaria attramentaria TaxID=370345 RepID=A0ABD0LJJ0_9CAEN